MKKKKLFKYIPITIMTAGVVLAASVAPPYFLNNSGTPATQTFNDNQQVNDADYTDQLDYIRSDVAKQDGMTNTVKSIELATNSSSTTAAIVTKMNDSTLLYIWGNNSKGQLGLGDNDNRDTPTQVPSFSSSPITQIVFGGLHSAALLENGSLYTWGDNSKGQLGLGDNDNRLTPTQVPSFSSSPITQIVLGGLHSAALLENGSLYTWGGNNFGQLGLGDNDNRDTPTEVKALSDLLVTQIALGYEHSVAMLKDGSLYTWGDNSSGQLGLGDNDNRDTPTQVPSFSSSPITQIVAGSYNSAALLENGSLYTWGGNNFGQLGLGDSGSATKRPNPTQVPSFSSSPITQIVLGSLHFVVLLENGDLYTWGANFLGQLGLDDNDNRLAPTQVTFFSSLPPIAQIKVGEYCSLAMLKDGSLYTWGDNSSGQLGLGDIGSSVSIPTWMPYLGKDSHITADDKITAKQAVDSFWVDGAFNEAGFKNSFNLINIPDVADQTITMDTEPTYNNSIGTVTIKVKFKYFYDENGLAVADTSATDMTISGFKLTIITNITALPDDKYSHSVVIDKWNQAVTVDNKLNYNKLSEYLDLSTVPTTAEFEITNENRDFKTGVLTFDITSTQVFDNNVIIDTPIGFTPFSIILKLTPRITKMSTKASTSDLTAAELKAKLFNEDGLVKDPIELENYMSIVAPVDDVKYYLIADSWDFNPTDGTLVFTIYADKYYDDEGIEKSGGVANADSQLSFNLSLKDQVGPTKSAGFEWWWIVIAIGGAAIIGALVWLLIKKQKERHLAVKRILQQRSAEQAK